MVTERLALTCAEHLDFARWNRSRGSVVEVKSGIKPASLPHSDECILNFAVIS
ncbi:hypothetical protein [Nostoc sp. UHCC 0302]|uniref:hypothetical protein n=1 Tax=Nostoc sp. UHCC 0302 TaxID=3134896 RepID=UPI00311C89E3